MTKQIHGVCAIFWVILCTLVVPLVHGQSLQEGLGFLIESQDTIGTWGNPNKTRLRDTAVVLDTMALLGRKGQSISGIASLLTKNNDDLARQINTLANARQDVSALVDKLLASQNPEITNKEDLRFPGRGWGLSPGFGSSLLDTAIALRAIRANGIEGGLSMVREALPASGKSLPHPFEVPAGSTDIFLKVRELNGNVRFLFRQPDNTRITLDVSPSDVSKKLGPILNATGKWTVTVENRTAAPVSYTSMVGYTQSDGNDSFRFTTALAYLGIAQNADGGWGITPGEESHLMVTAEVLRTLATSGNVFVPSDTLDRAVTWLRSNHQNPDGGFSTETGSSNVHETALASIAIGLVDDNITLDAATSFLVTKQLFNGSWANDPYQTAIAIQALLVERPRIEPVITTDGGNGVGQNFLTDLDVVVIKGTIELGTDNIKVNHPSATVSVDTETGNFTITVNLNEGENTLTFTPIDSFGRSGTPALIDITRDSTLVGDDVIINPGFNMVGLRLNPVNSLGAFDLLEKLGPQVSEVKRLDAATGVYETAVQDETGFIGTNFILNGLDGLIIIADDSSSTHIAGRTVNSPIIDLLTGVNVLTIPNPPDDLDVFGLINLIGDESVVSSIQHFSLSRGDFETAVYHDSTLAGTNFPIEGGVAYLVSMREDVPGFELPIGNVVDVVITSHTGGITLRDSPITVSGTVSGEVPIDVTINEISAAVTGSTFIASVPLNSGSNKLVAVATDASGKKGSDTVSVFYDPIDFSIARGGSVTGFRTFTGDAVAFAQVAGVNETPTGVPADVTYSRLSIGPITATKASVDFQINVALDSSIGIYEFQIEYQLLDSGGNPLGPLFGNVFEFRIEITP